MGFNTATDRPAAVGGTAADGARHCRDVD
jgi:hypothetical protein